MLENELDPQRILDALGCRSVQTVQRIKGGSDTAIWRVTTPDAIYALRVFQRGEARICEREAAVMSQAAVHGVPTPAVHAIATWQERPAMLIAWLPGSTMADALQRRPYRAWHLGRIFGRAQAAIHAILAPEILCATSDSWIRLGGSRYPALQERLRNLPHQQDALLHLDYHPLNVMTDGTNITGVIDWANARACDPRADVARTETIMLLDSTEPDDKGFVLTAKKLVIGRFLQGWRRGYAEIQPGLQEMPFFYAWAGAMMENDLAGKRMPEELAHVHRWTARKLQKLNL